MSSDFLVDSITNSRRQFVVQVKSSESLSDAKTIEKLEIKRRYWLSKQIPWFLVTTNEIDPVIKQNISWMYPTKSEGLIDVDLVKPLPILEKAFHKSPDSKVIDICKQMDAAYNLDLGQTLRDVRTLIANGYLKFDIHQLYRTLVAADLVFCPLSDMEDLLHVANQ